MNKISIKYNSINNEQMQDIIALSMIEKMQLLQKKKMG